MSDQKEPIQKIYELREKLNKLIEEKGNLLDDDVLSLSKELDSLLSSLNGGGQNG